MGILDLGPSGGGGGLIREESLLEEEGKEYLPSNVQGEGVGQLDPIGVSGLKIKPWKLSK